MLHSLYKLMLVVLLSIVLMTTHQAQAAPLTQSSDYSYSFVKFVIDGVEVARGQEFLVTGEHTFEVHVINTGNKTWYRTPTRANPCAIHLGTGDEKHGEAGNFYTYKDRASPFYYSGYLGWLEESDQSNNTYKARRVMLQAGQDTVAPGQTAVFRWKGHVPTGLHQETANHYWNLVAEGNSNITCNSAQWLPEQNVYVRLNIPKPKFTIVDQKVINSTDKNVYQITLRNDGPKIWYKQYKENCDVFSGHPYPYCYYSHHRVFLATGAFQVTSDSNPYRIQDHVSPVYVSGGTGWIASNRAEMGEAEVWPGQNATFTFELGSYNGSMTEYFTPIIENIGWMESTNGNLPYLQTSASMTNQSPNKPSLNQPSNNASFTLGSPVSFSWSGSDPNNDTLRYSILVASDSSFSSSSIVAGDGYQFDQQDLYGTSYSWTPTQIGTYYYRVIAFDGQVSGPWSDIQSFTVQATTPANQPPNKPSLNQPSNNASFTLGNLVNFSWSGSDPNNDTLRYSILVASDSSFSSSSIVAGDGYQFDQQDLYGTNYSWTPTQAGTYYYRVIAFDGLVSGPWSDVQSFTVQQINQPTLLEKPSFEVPGNNQITSYKPELIWSNSLLVGADAKYKLQIARDSSFANIVWTDDNIAPTDNTWTKISTSYTKWTPSANGSYYVRVMVYKETAQSAWSNTSKFFVVNPVIFIPGVMGSQLATYNWENKETDLWPVLNKKAGIPVQEGLTSNGFETLKLSGTSLPDIKASDIIRNYPKYEVEIAGHKLVERGGDDVYNDILNFLRVNYNYQEYQVNNNPYKRAPKDCDVNSKATLFVFAYDWRLDIERNALHSSEHFNGNEWSQSLANYVKCIKMIYGQNIKVDIIAHSMGGLVAGRYAREYPQNIGNLITLGTPWLGAPKNLYTMWTGDLDIGDVQNYVITQGQVRELAEYYPGVHELLLNKGYFNFYTGLIELPKPLSFDKAGDGNATPDYIFDYNEYKQFVDDYFPGSNPVLDHNEVFHTVAQYNWGEKNMGFKYYPVVGLQKDGAKKIEKGTIGQVKITAKSCQKSNILQARLCQVDYDFERVSGDGTVPYYSATRATRESTGLNYLPANTPVCEVDLSHDGVSKNQELYKSYILPILQGEKSTCPTNLSGDLWQRQRQQLVTTFAPMYEIKSLGVAEMWVTDQTGLKTGYIQSDGYYKEIERVGFLTPRSDSFFAYMPANQTFVVTLKTTDTTSAMLRITKDDGSVVKNMARYNDLTLPANTLLQITLTPNGIQGLQQDSDNDGMVDTIVPPTALASGELAADTTSPLVDIKLTDSVNGQYQAVISATDVGQAGLKQVFYSIDGTHFNIYTDTFTINSTEVVTVYAFADDYLGNRSGLFEQAVPRQNVNTTFRLVAPETVPLNIVFTVTVRLENTLASQDIQGVIVNLKPANLNMLTAVCNQPDTDQPDNLIPYDSATYPACQPTSSGYIVTRWLTSSQVISGSGSWVGLAFKATQEGCTDILFDQHQLVNSQAKFVPHDVFTTTVCALTNQQTLTGVVHLQSRPMGKYAGAQVTITNTQGIISKTVTDANGYYTFTNLALGDYTLRVRHPLFVGATRNITLTGMPNPIFTRSFAGDIDQSSNVNNCQKTVTLRDWYILAAGILPVNNPAFDINADGVTDGRDMIILFNNIGTPNMCTTNAPNNYHRQATTPMPQLIASQAQLTWQPQANGITTLSISHVMTELIKSIGMRLEIPNGMTITTVTPHDKFASADSFLNLYQQDNVVYITLATPEDQSLDDDALILTMQTNGGETQQIKMTDYNIVALAKEPHGNKIFLPIIKR